jgi:hypothetical protein
VRWGLSKGKGGTNTRLTPTFLDSIRLVNDRKKHFNCLNLWVPVFHAIKKTLLEGENVEDIVSNKILEAIFSEKWEIYSFKKIFG